MDAYRQFLARIGVFFMVVAAFLFILFVSSDLAEKVDFDYLFLSLLALGIGWLFHRRRPRAASAGRFAFLRRRREHGRDRKQPEKK
ncbi:MAG: hypothetical protein ACM3QS_09610 [Bacteroidota bacterium]